MPAAFSKGYHIWSSHQMYVPPLLAGSNRGGGPISELQEYVQSDRRFPVSSNRPVLKWDWDHRMANTVTLEFCATVSFILGGVPHFSRGSWHTSKKAAQRDAAARVLVLLSQQWGAEGKTKGTVYDSSKSQTKTPAVQQLKEYLTSVRKESSPQWRCTKTEAGWQAIVELCIFDDVPHTLQGSVCSSEGEACEDTAARALWYLKAPSHMDAYEVSYQEVFKETLEPPLEDVWIHNGDASLSQQRAADQRTALMRVQNQLQKKYGKILSPGTPVWEWSFEYEPDDENQVENAPIAPESQCCCARVWIAGLNREFVGQWCDGQKAAQHNVCAKVSKFLAEEDAEAKVDSSL